MMEQNKYRILTTGMEQNKYRILTTGKDDIK